MFLAVLYKKLGSIRSVMKPIYTPPTEANITSSFIFSTWWKSLKKQLHECPSNMMLRACGITAFPMDNPNIIHSNKLLLLYVFIFNQVDLLYTNSYTNIPIIYC